MAKALLHHAERTDQSGPAGLSVELHVSQRVLGNIASGSRESVSKHLQDWRRRGLIDLRKGSIIIRDAQALERLI
jgi:CRP-like cAMP-binding protein